MLPLVRWQPVYYFVYSEPHRWCSGCSHWVRYIVGSISRSDKTIDCKIGICCFTAKHAALSSKNKYCSDRNRDNESWWSDMSTRGLLFHRASTIKIQSYSVSHWQFFQNTVFLYAITLPYCTEVKYYTPLQYKWCILYLSVDTICHGMWILS